ncbi:MAG: phenylalanine--tRNA ligase subunit beta [Phycisphaeraceae bacterium]|nr:MAG: phenylalanine--tRNA ligase subunit beta [Phycisphaeraceae bacterium]
MLLSLRWINEYLEPGDLGADEAADALMNVGFPIEARDDFTDARGQPDTRLDAEVTSNRGDCLSLIGLARELAAKTGRGLKLPDPALPSAAGGPVGSFITLHNRVPDQCPRFTVRVIRGVNVGPSPAWLVRHLESLGQRSINNVVDATNFVNFEAGNPSHVFDLDRLAGRQLVVRAAALGERLLTLDGKERTLRADEIVVADAERAQSLAGVIGGGESQVSDTTRDVVVEVATWDPVAVRRASRRLGVRTDASYRFERRVDPRTLEWASRRVASLIVSLAGGQLCEGVLEAGRPLPDPTTVPLRFARCRSVLGFDVPDAEIESLLASQGLSPSRTARVEVGGGSGGGGVGVVCEIPPHRTDLHREIDLIEEVARTKGLDAVPVADRLPVEVKPPQDEVRALREVGRVLTGLGFYETVTFSFVRPDEGRAWLSSGLEPASVDDERRGAEPTLRTSVIPGLLACRRANQDGQVKVEGGVRLFEVSRVFAQQRNPSGSVISVENRNVAFLLDGEIKGKRATVDDRQAAVRAVRGVIEHLAAALAGPAGPLECHPAEPHAPSLDPAAYARVTLGGTVLGYLGLVGDAAAKTYGLEGLYACAELNLGVLIGLFPPGSRVHDLPAFPCVERDLSPIVDEATSWSALAGAVGSLKLPRLEAVEFVGTFRGKQAGAGKKSVTMRLRFRDPAKTLRHEEVDGEIEAIVSSLNARCGAAWRTV